MQVSQICQRRKSDANKEDFENKLNLTCQAQSTPPKNKDLNQGILHLWSQFGGPSLNGWWDRTDKLKMGYILTLKLNLTLNVKVNHPQKQ